MRKTLAMITGLLLLGSLTACATDTVTSASSPSTPSAKSTTTSGSSTTSKTTTAAATSSTTTSPASSSKTTTPSISEKAKAELDSLVAKAGCSNPNFRAIENSQLPYATGAAACTDATTSTQYFFVTVEPGHVDDVMAATYKRLNTTKAIGYVDGGTWLALASPTSSDTPSLDHAKALVEKMGTGKALVKQ